MCGGTVSWRRAAQREGGLSPRVRGNPLLVRGVPVLIGSIPACAGEPHLPSSSPSWPSVYPRVCGGTRHLCGFRRTIFGLSPRVRGNLGQQRRAATCIRSIPACAGEPRPLQILLREERVYPRVCGGTPSSSTMRASLSGLSPRVRGNPEAGSEGLPAGGSIPACAGEPSIPSRRIRTGGVYPRVCGGTGLVVVTPGGGLGLSPRVRGNR